jgi:hypothetical protein
MTLHMMLSRAEITNTVAPQKRTAARSAPVSRPNWIADELDGSARRRAEEEQAQAKERLADQMRKDLQ